MTRKGDNLTFRSENGKTTVSKSDTEACRQIPIGPCIVYERVGYMGDFSRVRFARGILRVGVVRLVSRRTGVVTKLEVIRVSRPTESDSSLYPQATPGKSTIAYQSSQRPDPPRLEWRFPRPKEYEEYSFDGWDGEDRIKLHTITKPLIDTDVRRTTRGWVLRTA